MHLNKYLFKNFTWLAISQGANVVIPLIIYPYLLRVIGIEEFGLVVFAQAVVTYFVYIIDFGFSISAVRETSIHRSTPEKLSATFSQLYTIKGMLLIICFACLLLLVSFISQWRNEQLLFLTSFSIVAGQLVLPAWLFQGLEKMNGVAIMNIISKVLFLLLTLLLVQENTDYKWVNFYLGLSQVMVGCASIIYVMHKFRIRFQLPSVLTIKSQLKENQSIFLSVFMGFLSCNSNLIILGLMTNPVATGYYGIVEKVLLAIRAPAILLYQTVFPKVCILAGRSFGDLLQFLKTITRLVLVSFIPLGIAVFFLSEEVVRFFSGDYLETPALLLKIVSFVPLFAALNIPACQTLLAYNFKNSYTWITVTGAFFNITLNIILISFFAALGAAVTALATELFITTALFLSLALRHKSYSVHGVFKLIDKK